MIDFTYLQTGMYGLARAHQAGTMAGHLGAAVAAGYLFGEVLSDLPDPVYRGMEGELKRIIAGEEAFWFNPVKAGITPTQLFAPLESAAQQPTAIDPIAAALDAGVGQLRQSGHNIIFASIALRGLADHPDLATPPVVAGITKLITQFANQSGGRGYLGEQLGWRKAEQFTIANEAKFPAYDSVAQMVEITFGELIATARLHKQGFGGLWHLINHAAAITEVAQYGFPEIAQRALPAHHQHVQLWRTLPDLTSELGPTLKASSDPRRPDYWNGMFKRDQARLTHRVKTLYGYHTLRRNIESDPLRNQADEAFLYLMA